MRLRLADGRELIDGMASWWCAIHGYRHPALDAAVREQLERMAHVMFGGLTHEPAVRLAERLTELAPGGLERVFFADSGSVSVEVAIKLALQYQRARGRPERTRLLTVRGGYHGDTLGRDGGLRPGRRDALAVRRACCPQQVVRGAPAGRLRRAARPGLGRGGQGARPSATPASSPAVIAEPVVQGAGGMRFHSPACVRLLREVCDEHGLLLILDEIATGFGRSGAMFACEHAGVSPDVMCVGKALTGGYMTLAATLCTAAVAATVSAGEGGGLMHGPTFMANPLACAVALASLELLGAEDWRGRVARDRGGPAGGPRARARAAGRARRARARGDRRDRAASARRRRRRHARPPSSAACGCGRSASSIYAMPPYVIGEEDLAAVTAAMVARRPPAEPRPLSACACACAGA